MNAPVHWSAKAPMMVVSLLLSILLWTYFQVTQPSGARTAEAPVGVLGFDAFENRYIKPIELQDSTVLVRIEGPEDQLTSDQNTLARIMRQARLSVFVDMSSAKEGENVLPLHIQYLPDQPFTFELLEPSIKFDLERRLRRFLPVSIEATGQLPQDLNVVYVDAAAQPSTVAVEGPAPQVNQVKRVRVFLDLSQVSGDSPQYGTPEVLDDNDRQVTNVDVSPSVVKLLPALAPSDQTHRVLVQANFAGQPALGYEVSSYSIEPNEIAVEGSPGTIARLETVMTEPIGLNGVHKSATYDVALQLPAGVKAVSVRRVRVSVNVEPRSTAPPTGRSFSGPQ